jgi:hypothetical protein
LGNVGNGVHSIVGDGEGVIVRVAVEVLPGEGVREICFFWGVEVLVSKFASTVHVFVNRYLIGVE